MKIINLHLVLLSLIFSSGLLFSCEANNKTAVVKEIDFIEIETVMKTTNPTEKYQKFVMNLDTTKMSSSKQAIEKYKELYATATQEEADEGFLIFDKLYISLALSLDDQHYIAGEEEGIYDKYAQIAGIYNGYNDGKDAPPEMLAYHKELANHGFGIGMAEGSTYVLQNRDFMKDVFYDKVSQPMKKYLIQQNKQSKEIYASDGGLVISPTHLAELVVWAEKFIKENPTFHSKLLENVKWDRKAYLTILFEGMDNTPVFDYETKKLNKDFEEAYKTLITTYSETETATIIKPYYEAIKNNDTKKQKELIAKYQEKDIISKNEY